MLVKDLMSTSVISVNPDNTYDEIVFLMQCEDIGIVPVCDVQNHLLGVITDRDLLLRRNSGDIACDFMTPSPVTVNADDDIHQAAMKFSQYAVRRLPVLDNGHLTGILSFKDLAKKKVFAAEIGHIIYNICNHQ